MAGMRNPRSHFRRWPSARPEPLREIPVTPSRMIHFFDPSNEKMLARLPDMAASADILLGNLEDAIPADRKEAARAGLVRGGPRRSIWVERRCGRGSTRSNRPGCSTIL